MAVFRKSDEQPFTLQGNHIAGLATVRRGAAELEVWRSVVDAGSATPLHRHDHEEILVILSGRGRARIDDQEEQTFEAGDTLILPAGRLHQLFADTDGESIVILPVGSRITSPEGDELDLPWRA